MNERAGLVALRAVVIGLGIAAGLAGHASAQAADAPGEPLSAIDWLSDVLAEPPLAESAPETGGSPVESIATSSLDAINPDATGLLPRHVTGLPVDLWARSDTATLSRRLAQTHPEAVPALQALFKMLLLAELDPPADSNGSGAFLTVKVDRLLELGALEEAAALIEASQVQTPDLFRRAFDISLLIGTEDAACARQRARPNVAPSLTARIFCLARGGDWHAAAVAFESAQALEQLSAEDEALIARFLDPDLFEDEGPLPAPERITPLTLRLYEAIGEALPPGGLPLAFEHSELSPATGWKARIEAGERLARAGALAPGQLIALYTERAPAASGGVWVRVEAVQRFDAAIASGDPGMVTRTLARAWDALHAAELEVPFAEFYTEALLRLPLRGAPSERALRVALLSADYESAALSEMGDDRDDLVFLRAIARGETARIPSSDRMARAIAPTFGSTGPAAPLSEPLESLLQQGKTGEAILAAIDQIATGATGDPRRISEGLALLRRVGLEDTARRTALQLMILERRG